jgi:hypothetical protein
MRFDKITMLCHNTSVNGLLLEESIVPSVVAVVGVVREKCWFRQEGSGKSDSRAPGYG